jgi:membrane protein YqaA with SNARE-associated domain
MGWFRDALLALGWPGLLAIAIVDSSGVPLPGGVDVVVILLSAQQPALFPLAALLAAGGSAIGCWVLYRVGRKGGSAVLARVSPKTRDRVQRTVRHNDVLAVSAAMLGPPPFPTKVFVLMAGVVGMDAKRFVAAVFTGRLVRYGAEGWLAARFGDRAGALLEEHAATIGLVLVASVLLVVLARRLAARRTAARPRARGPADRMEEQGLPRA